MYFKELTDVFDKYRSDKDIFHDLMQLKAREILLVATLFDSFILERDGQLSEQLYGEYYQLNLSNAPRITSATSPENAIEKLNQRPFDMVILMAGIDVKTPVALGKQIRKMKPDIPIILLANNNSILPYFDPASKKLAHINRIFVWNGYSKIFLAITKYVEDFLNVDRDTSLGMVRVILLIEDSVRYYSRYLPLLYSEIMKQTQRLIADENLDEMNKVLRMRARPKVLLASSYEEAEELFNKHRKYLLTVISDVRFQKDGVSDPEAGLKFTKFVKEKMPDLPLLIQSSEIENMEKAVALGASYIDKNSDSLALDIRNFLLEKLGFGEFIFKYPSGDIIAATNNMEDFEKMLKTIPQESLLYHANRNDFSAWLMARGEVLFARILRSAQMCDFEEAEQMREFIIDIFENVKHLKTRGRVINFDESVFGKSSYITRFANGSLGGKGRGITFINNLIEHIAFSKHIPEINIRIPTTTVIGIDEFDFVIDNNNLRGIIYNRESDYDQIKTLFLGSRLSDGLQDKLKRFIALVDCPLAVRSSGLFEDMLMQPFAGIYSTYLLPNNHPDLETRLKQLSDAIKLVFASIFSPKARAYFDAVNYKIEEEKMAVIIQEVVGNRYGDVYYPHISGTAQSYNYYPVAYLKPEDGLAVAALGLGSYVVDGEQAFRFSPMYPRLDIISGENLVKNSQKYFYALDMSKNDVNLFDGEDACYVKLDISEAEKQGALNHLASVYDFQNNTLKTGLSQKGPRVINFADILKYDHFPLAKTIEAMLEIGEKSMSNPVEIEYAVDMNKKKNGKITFYLLQMKPLIQNADEININTDEIVREDLMLLTSKGMGNGKDTICDVIFIDPAKFDKSETERMVEEISRLNESMKKLNKKYILIGPGRWGTRDRWLGIPVGFNQISQARVIVEVGLEDFQIDSSLGSHFFHNITSMNIGYFTVPFRSNTDFIDWGWLKSLPAVETTNYFVHVRLPQPLTIIMDGKKGISLIKK